MLQAILLAAIAYPTTKIRVNATCRKCPHKEHRMEMKKAISCTILRHTKKLIAAGVLISRLTTPGSKNYTTHITQILTQSHNSQKPPTRNKHRPRRSVYISTNTQQRSK